MKIRLRLLVLDKLRNHKRYQNHIQTKLQKAFTMRNYEIDKKLVMSYNPLIFDNNYRYNPYNIQYTKRIETQSCIRKFSKCLHLMYVMLDLK